MLTPYTDLIATHAPIPAIGFVLIAIDWLIFTAL